MKISCERPAIAPVRGKLFVQPPTGGTARSPVSYRTNWVPIRLNDDATIRRSRSVSEGSSSTWP